MFNKEMKMATSKKELKKELESLVDLINISTNSPVHPWTRTADGLRANIGNYHIDHAYGGVQLNRMSNVSGGVTAPLGLDFCSKREMAEKLRAFLRGIEAVKGECK
jgi:hypothetical protein